MPCRFVNRKVAAAALELRDAEQRGRLAEILSDTPKTKSGGPEKVVGAKNETK